MQNLLKLTQFLRALADKPLGFQTIYHVTEGKTYATTVSGLTAVAAREGVKIGTTQIIIVEAGVVALEAVKVTVK
jgi:hypothetical protein